MRLILERLFGPRLEPEDRPESDPDLEAQKQRSDETLRKANASVVAQRRVAAAAQSVADAIVASGRNERR